METLKTKIVSLVPNAKPAILIDRGCAHFLLSPLSFTANFTPSAVAINQLSVATSIGLFGAGYSETI